MIHLGNVPASTTIYIPFATYAGSTGASVTCSGLAVTDVEIYKNGSVTQRASDAGIALLDTDGIDFDGITGLHGFSIDLSDNTDASFYAVGSWYWVVVSAITVDSQTVTFLAATFRIAPAEGIAGYPKSDVHALKGDATSATDLQDFADAGYDPATNKVQGVVLVDTLTTYTNNTVQTGDSFARIGAAGVGLTNIDLPNQTFDLIGNITGNLSGSVGSVTTAITLPTIPTGWITADGIAADAIGSSELAASAVAEIQSGLSTLAAADIRTAIGLASANLDTQIGALALAATALSTTQWTNTLATNLGTTNTSVAAILIDTGTDIPVSITAESVKTAAIKVKTDQMVFTTPNRVDASATVSIAAADIRAALGMSAADLDSQLDAILAAASASAGSGARTVTITVNDGATVLENAIVRMTEGVNSFRALTNVSGVAVFNLDDATYTVSITKAGYTYAGTTIIVNGTETATYSMSVVAVAAPASPSKTAIEVLCLDEDDDPVAGIDIDMRRVVIPVSGTNTAYLGTKVTVTSNVSGIARFEVAQGITVEYKRGTADVWTRLTVDSDSVTNVTSFIGSP